LGISTHAGFSPAYTESAKPYQGKGLPPLQCLLDGFQYARNSPFRFSFAPYQLGNFRDKIRFIQASSPPFLGYCSILGLF
jgi:hypothetical protein